MTDEAISRREYDADKRSIWKEIRRVAEIIEGPPHPGMETRVNAFLTRFETLEEERDKQHKANRFRLNAIIILLTAIAAWIAIFHH